jgi:putative mRNA 3-end processing factor
MNVAGLIEARANGLYCPVGDFHIDPWQPVKRAVITHAHSDHAHPGSNAYLTAGAGGALLRARVGDEARIETLEYGQELSMGGVRVSLHPAGHILGSAQVRIESGGDVWVVSGDYKLAPDSTCAPFEPIRCRTFITESTFGLPVFRWPGEEETMAAIEQWWRANREAGRTSLLYAYPLGKAQRLLAGLDAGAGEIRVHGAVARFNAIYGITAEHWSEENAGKGSLVVAPPSAHNTPWSRRFGPSSAAFVSGWMRIRGARRRRSLDRGFVLSDHADWPALLRAIDATGAESVWVTHGFKAPLVRWLEEHGREAVALETNFEGERDEAAGDVS